MSSKHTAMLALADLDSMSIQEARRKFFSYREKGVFRDCLFDDNRWPASDEYANYTFDFEIDEGSYQRWYESTGLSLDEFSRDIKVFVVCQLGHLSLNSLRSFIHEVKEMIKMEMINSFGDVRKYYHLERLSDFLALLPVSQEKNEFIEDIIESLENVEESDDGAEGNGQRTLASFESYFKFDDILRSFWKEAEDISERLFYFPIWLWWNVSAILPLRPREFVVTPRKCLSEINGKRFLAVRRSIIKGGDKTKGYSLADDFIIKKYQIPNALADEIQWYIDNTKQYAPTNLDTLFIADTHYAKWNRCKPYTSRYFTYSNLRTNLRYFFEQIVEDRYGYTILFDIQGTSYLKENEIHYMHLGDTRHLALINLIAEGATPMVAMMLAGHDNPEMSAHYYSNIATLIECRTYRQYKKLIRGQQTYALSKTNISHSVGKFITLVDKGRCYSEKVRDDDFSDCYKVVGPSGEVGFCRKCTYYRDESKDFKDSKDIYRNRIINECQNLEEIVRKVRKDYGEPEDIAQVLLKLRDADYSYQQYLKEVMAETDGEKQID